MPRTQPRTLPPEGLLVGWSLEAARRRAVMGFATSVGAEPVPDAQEAILQVGEGHLLTVAPTGAGKGVACIIPALLRYPGPIIVIDPKGENVAVTARRRTELGHEVVVLDPFDVAEAFPSDRLNPLDLLDPTSPSLVDDAAMLAAMMIQGNVSERDPFWDRRAEQLLTALVLHVATARPSSGRTLGEVRRLAYLPPASLGEEMAKAVHPEVRLLATMILNEGSTTTAGVLALAQSHVEFMRGPLADAATDGSTFALEDVTTGRPLSIFVVMPPDKLESHAKLLRLWVGTLIGALLRRRTKPVRPTLFLLDEAAQLGVFPPLRQAMTLLRGYGVKTWSFWQDLSQLRLLYPADWETMFNNCQVHQLFGLTTMRAAAAAAEITGFGNGVELLDLEADEMLLSIAGDLPVVAQKPSYLTDPVFAGHFDPNPYHVQDAAPRPPAHGQRIFKRRPEAAAPAAAVDHASLDALLTRLATGPVAQSSSR